MSSAGNPLEDDQEVVIDECGRPDDGSSHSTSNEGTSKTMRKRRVTKRRVRKPTAASDRSDSSSSGVMISRKKTVLRRTEKSRARDQSKCDTTADQIRQILKDARESVRRMQTQEDALDVLSRLRLRLSRLEVQDDAIVSAEDSACEDSSKSTTAAENFARRSLQKHLKLNLQNMSRSTNSSPAHSACSSPLNGSPNRSEPRPLSYSQSARAVSSTTDDLASTTATGVLDRATSFDTAQLHSPLPLRSSAKKKLFGSPKRFNIGMLTPRSPKKSPKSASAASSPLSSPAAHKTDVLKLSPIDLTRHKVHLKRLIGHGGTSLIYEATVDGWTVAAKVYHQYFPADNPKDEQRKRIQLILNALCALPRHQNMLPLLGYTFINENRLVVLCERVDCTLRDLIDARRTHYYHTVLMKNSYSSESMQSSDSLSSVLLSQTLEPGAGQARRQDSRSQSTDIERRSPPLPSLPLPPFTAQEILGLWKQAVEGVAFLHRLPEPCNMQGGGRILAVWHRDLKSENIMCTRLGADVDEVLLEQETDSASSLTASGRIPCDIVGSGLCDGDREAEIGSLHRKYALKLGDFDEMHVVYDMDDRKSPIQWQEGSPNDSSKTLPEASSGRVMRRSRTMSFSARQPSAYERLSLNVGTLEFMAPEMANRQTALYDERIDVWSLGMVLYELLTLELPYGRDSYTQFELPGVVQRGIRPTLPGGYLVCNIAKAHSDDNDDDEEDDDDEEQSDTQQSHWEKIVRLFFDCTQRDPEDRPSASVLLQRINTILENFIPSQ